MTSKTQFGLWLRYVREQRLRLSQFDLAVKIGTRPETISNWENGVHDVPRAGIEAICRLADIELPWTLVGAVEAYSSDRTTPDYLSESEGRPPDELFDEVEELVKIPEAV